MDLVDIGSRRGGLCLLNLCQVVDYDSGEVRLYVDGQRVTSGTP